jgi:hypothetical protein
MTRTTTEVQAITLPSWSDSASVASYVVSLAFMVLPFVALIHPAFHPTSATVQAWGSAVGLAVAGLVQVANVIRHAVVSKSAIAAAATASTMSPLRLTVLGKGHPAGSASSTDGASRPLVAS